jgi:hypothetical protein
MQVGTDRADAIRAIETLHEALPTTPADGFRLEEAT